MHTSQPETSQPDISEPDTCQTLETRFLNIIEDLREYLSCQKKTGAGAFALSTKAEKIMSRWSRPVGSGAALKCEGPITASIMIVDSEGTFYVGKAGELLKKILNAMNLDPGEIIICDTANLAALQDKIAAAAPKVVITLGEAASQLLLQSEQPFEKIRSRFHSLGNIRIMPTFHPSLLLQQPNLKRQVWEDMKKVMTYPGLTANGS